MQKDNTEFDFMVRSMLENAEEEVPSRVWVSVESRIGKTHVVPAWRRVAVAASVAAVLAVGSFVGLRMGSDTAKDNSTFDIKPTVEFVADAASSGSGTENLASETAKTVSGTLLADNVSRREPQAVRQPAAVQEGTEDVISVGKEDEEVPENAGLTVSEPVQETAAKDHEAVSDGDGTDPFALMEWEDSRKASRGRRMSLTAGGDMQTNGDPASLTGQNRWNASSHKGPSSTTVTQLGTRSTYSIPMSFGVKARFGLDRDGKWSVGTGVIYSMMSRTFVGVYQEVDGGTVVNTYNSDIHNTLHYVGVPLNFYYDVLSGNRINFYAYAGGAAEKLVLNKYRVEGHPDAVSYGDKTKDLQFSLTAGIGVQFKVSDLFGIYLDPSLRYYFKNTQPTSIRTQQPLMMSFEVGMRFNI